MADTDLAVLAPLQHLIDQIVRSTPIGATEQLAANLTVQAAVWVGRNVMPRTAGLAPFVVDVDSERQRQLATFGDQRHPDGTGMSVMRHFADAYREQASVRADSGSLSWKDVLQEEVYEALAETDPARLRAELVQVAAVCAAWVSDIDRRPAPEQPERP